MPHKTQQLINVQRSNLWISSRVQNFDRLQHNACKASDKTDITIEFNASCVQNQYIATYTLPYWQFPYVFQHTDAGLLFLVMHYMSSHNMNILQPTKSAEYTAIDESDSTPLCRIIQS